MCFSSYPIEPSKFRDCEVGQLKLFFCFTHQCLESTCPNEKKERERINGNIVLIVKSLAAQENYQSSGENFRRAFLKEVEDSSDAKPQSPLSIDQPGIRESTHVFPHQGLHFPSFLLYISYFFFLFVVTKYLSKERKRFFFWFVCFWLVVCRAPSIVKREAGESGGCTCNVTIHINQNLDNLLQI